MGQVQQSIVVALGMEQAQDEWRAYVYRDEVGASLGPEGRLAAGAQDDVEQELVTFEEAGSGSTRVTLRADFDEDEDVDVSTLRADVNDELARYREFVERRNAA